MSARAPRAALADELRLAAAALEAIEGGDALPDALASTCARRRPPLPPTSLAAVRDMTSRAVRQLALCGALCELLNQRAPNAGMLSLQRLVLAQMLDPVRADSTTVDQAVEAAKRDPSLRAGAGFLNATLRRFLREREALLAQVRVDPVANWNFPRWWIDAVQRDHPAHWQSVLNESNRMPPLTLRTHAQRTTPARYLEQLSAAGLPGRVVGPQAVRLEFAVPLERLPGWQQGLVSVQDAGAQMAAALLDVHDGMHVLDACAAPGGKTTHLLELAELDLLAADLDASRLLRVGENLSRLGQQARLRCADALDPDAFADLAPFDRILLDAPCTASGIVRRQPDVRWRRRRRDMETFSVMQQRLLAALWPRLAAGGKLLYATCSVFAAEGETVMTRFLEAHPDANRSPLSWSFAEGEPYEPVTQLLPVASGLRDHDGFFYAMVEKRV